MDIESNSKHSQRLFHTLGREIVKGQFSTNEQERESTMNVAAIRKHIVAFADPAQWVDGIAPDSSRWWFSPGKEKRQKRKEKEKEKKRAKNKKRNTKKQTSPPEKKEKEKEKKKTKREKSPTNSQ